MLYINQQQRKHTYLSVAITNSFRHGTPAQCIFHFNRCSTFQQQCHNFYNTAEQEEINLELFSRYITSSSAMAEKPYDWGALCLRLKSSLCSCRHCQWFSAGLTRHQRRRSYSPTRTDWPGQHNNLNRYAPGLPCTEHQRMSRSRCFTKKVGHLQRIFHREEGVAYQPLLVSEN